MRGYAVLEVDTQNKIYDEVRRTWDLGKSLGLVADNDNMVIKPLAKGLKSKNDCVSKQVS